MKKELKELQQLVEKWGTDRLIIGEHGENNLEMQIEKLEEEVQEIRDAYEKGDLKELVDGTGDSTVVLILIAKIISEVYNNKEIDFHYCLDEAYDVIKDRKGKMVNGKFVKEE